MLQNNRFQKQALSLIICSVFNTMAIAEDAIPVIQVTANPLDEIITPTSSVLSEEKLQAATSSTSDTAGLLKSIPGVQLQTGGGVSSLPVIRGMADDRLRIKVDGMDLISACGNHMNPPLSYIDPNNVGSAEVFAGVTPVSLGGDSLGSTIIVNSAKPEFSKQAGELLTTGKLGASYRSNGNAVSGNLKATAASELFSINYNGSWTKSDNYTAGGDFKSAVPAYTNGHNLAADEVGSSQYKSINHELSLAAKLENHLFNLKLGQQDIPYQNWVNQRMDMTANDSTHINLSYEGNFDWGLLETRFYQEKTRHKMQFADDKLYWYSPNSTAAATDGIPCTPSMGKEGCAAGMPMDTEGKNVGFSLKGSINLQEQGIVRLGTELQSYTLDDWWEASGKGMWPNTFWNINNGERDRLALFSEWEKQWSTQWLTLMGIRYEKVDMNAGAVQGYNTSMAEYKSESDAFNAKDREKNDNNIDLTLLTRYQFASNKSLELAYARKTRSPNLYERYTWSTGGMAMRMINMAGDGNGYVGNLDLEPEVAHTISTSIDFVDENNDQWEFSLTPYFTYIDDYIDAQRCSSANSNCNAANQTANDAFVYLQFVNQSARLYGADMSARFNLAEGTGMGDFTANGSISYVRGINATTDDNLYNIMPLNAELSITQQLKSWTNSIEVNWVDAKDRISSVRNELATSSYYLFNLRSTYQWQQLQINFGIENLFDRLYNHPLGGAYTGQGKTMSGTDVAWGTSVPGAGRSVYAGLNYKF